MREQGPESYAFVALETGPIGRRVHAHALLGGVHPPLHARGLSELRQAAALTRAAKTWRHGNIDLAEYNPAKGGAFYVSPCPDDWFIVGELRRHLSRYNR